MNEANERLVIGFEEAFKMMFGEHGKKAKHFKTRSLRIVVDTGTMSEEDIKLISGTPNMLGAFGGQWTPVKTSFYKAPNQSNPLGGVPLNTSHGLYMSADGSDPKAGQPFGRDNQVLEARENAALEPNTRYYWDADVTEQGHHSWKPNIRLVYSGTDYKGQHNIGPADFIGPLDMDIAGIPGTWTPDQ